MIASTSLRWWLTAVLSGLALSLRAVSTPAPATPAPAAAGQGAAATQAAAPQPATEAELAAVAARVPGAHVADLRATPIPGIYELRQGAELVYVTADGKYGFAGDLYRLADRNNLSDARRRELHKQIAEYNRLGVKVRYMFFPRTGPNTSSWSKAEQVWCSPDRRAALTAAKLGTPLKTAVCKPNPVADQYALGKLLGVNGTPGIVTERGELLPGYAPPDEMLQLLQEDAQPGKG